MEEALVEFERVRELYIQLGCAMADLEAKLCPVASPIPRLVLLRDESLGSIEDELLPLGSGEPEGPEDP